MTGVLCTYVFLPVGDTERAWVHLLRRIVGREGLDLASCALAALARQEAQGSVARRAKLAVGHGLRVHLNPKVQPADAPMDARNGDNTGPITRGGASGKAGDVRPSDGLEVIAADGASSPMGPTMPPLPDAKVAHCQHAPVQDLTVGAVLDRHGQASRRRREGARVIFLQTDALGGGACARGGDRRAEELPQHDVGRLRRVAPAARLRPAAGE